MWSFFFPRCSYFAQILPLDCLMTSLPLIIVKLYDELVHSHINKKSNMISRKFKSIQNHAHLAAQKVPKSCLNGSKCPDLIIRHPPAY